MDERVTLRSHLDRSASQTPHGVAAGDVIEAIAVAAIELASLLADGPLSGITRREGRLNFHGRQQEDSQVGAHTREFQINASNRRHWHGPVRAYIDECLAGTSGSGEADFNMRWIGSLVAESLRILVRGGVFLYPADARPSYREGRLRLLYEAHPMALVMEWAGGAASTGRRRALELGAETT